METPFFHRIVRIVERSRRLRRARLRRPEMGGKKCGHFPGKEEPDVGCPDGDRPRSFDTRFIDTDDTVVGFPDAEEKPRPERNVPGDDEKFPSRWPPRRTFDDPLPYHAAHEPSSDPPPGHDPRRRAPAHRRSQPRHASRPGKRSRLEHLRDHDPPQAVAEEMHPLPVRRLDERPKSARRLPEPPSPGAVPEVAYAETRLLEAAAEDAHLPPRHP